MFDILLHSAGYGLSKRTGVDFGNSRKREKRCIYIIYVHLYCYCYDLHVCIPWVMFLFSFSLFQFIDNSQLFQMDDDSIKFILLILFFRIFSKSISLRAVVSVVVDRAEHPKRVTRPRLIPLPLSSSSSTTTNHHATFSRCRPPPKSTCTSQLMFAVRSLRPLAIFSRRISPQPRFFTMTDGSSSHNDPQRPKKLICTSLPILNGLYRHSTMLTNRNSCPRRHPSRPRVRNLRSNSDGTGVTRPPKARGKEETIILTGTPVLDKPSTHHLPNPPVQPPAPIRQVVPRSEASAVVVTRDVHAGYGITAIRSCECARGISEGA